MPIILSPAVSTSSIFLDISAALDSRLSVMTGLPPVAWESDKYEPVKDTLYLRPTNIQGDTIAVTNNQDQTIGVYQIDVFAPAGKGKNESVLMADIIANHFKQDTKMSYIDQGVTVKSVSRNNISPDDNGWIHIAINVTYYAFSDRR